MADMTNKRLSVAPMIDWTTTDYRYFARLFNPHVYLYTEMISTGAMLYGNRVRMTVWPGTSSNWAAPILAR